HKRFGFFPHPELRWDESESNSLSLLPPRCPFCPSSSPSSREFFPPVFRASRDPPSRITHLINDVGAVLNDPGAARMQAGPDRIAEHQDSRSAISVGDVKKRGERERRFA